MSKKPKITMGVKKKPMTRQRVEAARPMSPNESSSDDNDQSICSRVRKIKQENVEGANAEIKIEPAEVTDSDLDYVKPEPNNGSIIKREAIYACTTCGKAFAKKKYLRQHTKIHNKSNIRHPCTDCERMFNAPAGLYFHRKIAHSSKYGALKRRHKCSICNLRCYSRCQLKRHMVIHQEKKFVCHTCRRAFATVRQRSSHRKRVHNPQKKIPCLECGKMFVSNAALKPHILNVHQKKEECVLCYHKFRTKCDLYTHLRTHIQEKPFFCPHCDRSFPGSASRKAHVRELHIKPGTSYVSDRKYDCDKCDQSFPIQRLLQDHRRTHQTLFPCPKCNAICRTQSALYRHQKKEHPLEGTITNPNQCPKCNKGFKYPHQLQQHMVKHTEEKKFECEICGKRLAQKALLNMHRLRMHGNPEDKTVPCLQCGEKFPTQTLLTQHINNRHRKPKKCFVCLFCGREFSKLQNHDDHLRRHIHEKPYFCENCDQCFENPGGIYKHQKVHMIDIECKLCFFKCKKSRELEKHVERAHMSTKGLVCVFCGKEMRNEETFGKHVLAHIEERHYPCSKCGKCLLTYYDQKIHRDKLCPLNKQK